MSSFGSKQKNNRGQVNRPAMESLENRALLSAAPATVTITVPGPIPTSAIAGVTVHDKIAVSVANNDVVKASGHVTITLFASADGALDTNSSQIQAPTGAGINIAPGKNHVYKINVKAFPENLSGSYFIIAEIVGSHVNETSGSSVAEVAIAPPNIDLSPNVTKAPTNGKAGHKIPVTVDVTNDGNVIAKGTLATAFSLSESSDGSSPVPLGTLDKHISIKAGVTKVLHFSVPLPLGIPTGNQYIVAEADPADTFLESNLNDKISVFQTAISIT